jgi:hypothetical protein
MFRLTAGCRWLPCGTPTSVLTKRWHWTPDFSLVLASIPPAVYPSQRSSNRGMFIISNPYRASSFPSVSLPHEQIPFTRRHQ